jgi:hypothetical protein
MKLRVAEVARNIASTATNNLTSREVATVADLRLRLDRSGEQQLAV